MANKINNVITEILLKISNNIKQTDTKQLGEKRLNEYSKLLDELNDILNLIEVSEAKNNPSSDVLIIENKVIELDKIWSNFNSLN
ncbi:hypothetical protein [Empedobacter falsenii]